jgi:hypothetical protein
VKQSGSTLIIAAALSAALANIGHASTFISTTTYSLNLGPTGSPLPSPVGTVTITTNSRSDTLNYNIRLTNGGKLTGVFLDAGTGGIAPHDLGSTTNSLGSFTDSFAAHGRSFSVTFKHTDLAVSTLGPGGAALIFAGVNTTKGLFGDALPGTPTIPSDPTPIPGALPLFVSGLGAIGLLGWRRKRKAQAA